MPTTIRIGINIYCFSTVYLTGGTSKGDRLQYSTDEFQPALPTVSDENGPEWVTSAGIPENLRKFLSNMPAK